MEYSTISLQNCDSEIKHNRIMSLSKDINVIIPFDGDDAMLAYIDPLSLSIFKNILRQNSIGYFDLKVQISEEEVIRYTTNVNKKRSVKVGDVVKVSGYGNAPFTVTEVGNTMATAVIELFNFSHVVTETHEKFSQHKNHEEIAFNPYYTMLQQSDDLCVVDIKFLNNKFNPSTLQSKIYLLIRVKSLMHKGGQIALLNPSHEFETIAKMFGMPIIHGIVESKTAVAPLGSEITLHTETLWDVEEMHMNKIPMTIENRFISFLTMKKYNFSAEQVYQHFSDTTRFKKQRSEFFKTITSYENGTITYFEPNINSLRTWLADNKLGQIEENLSKYLKVLAD